jgi:hypothetical protein
MTQVNSKTILRKIFENEFFKKLDSAALVKQFDISAGLRQARTSAKPAAKPMVLTTTVISNIPSQGISIITSGQYQFANNITWSPTGPGSAITITADNVTLDLNGFTLTINIPQNSSQQYNGININSANGVAITRGTVNGASYHGLQATIAGGLQVTGMTFGNISYSDITTPYATPCGIFLELSDDFIIQDCIIQDISVTAPSCAGIQVLASGNGKVTGCITNNFLNNDGGVQGFSYLLCWDIMTTECTCENFQSHYLGQTTTSGHTVIGFVPIFCFSLGFDNCSSTGMTGCCDDCHGMSVFLDAYVTVNNFSAKNVTDGITPRNTGAKATGLEVYGNNISIINCTVENIIAIVPQNLQSAGFSAWGDSIAFSGCTATGVFVTDAKGVPSTQYGYGTGFGWAPDPRKQFCGHAAHKTQYINCSSINCQLGFDTWFHTDSRWQNPQAWECPITILVQPDTATRTFSMDKCSESPDGKYHQVTITNIAANNIYPQSIPSKAEKTPVTKNANTISKNIINEAIYDYVIIGAGASGPIVANSLVSDGFTVLLLEAGLGVDPGDKDVWDPQRWFKVQADPVIEWGYKSVPQKNLNGRALSMQQSRCLGGCTVHNAMVYVRGGQTTYNYWEKSLGCTGWSYDNLKPLFEGLEKKIGILTGETDGLVDSFFTASKDQGLPFNQNYNQDKTEYGYVPFQFAIEKTGRVFDGRPAMKNISALKIH